MTKKKNKIYIAGPMSGIEEHNAPNFIRMGNLYKSLGWTVFNPIESPMSRLVQDGKLTGQEAYRACLALDLKFITEEADAIMMLEGWEKSPGAKAEHATAVALGIDILYER